MDRIVIAEELLKIAENMLRNRYGATDYIEWSAEGFFEDSSVPKSFFSDEKGFRVSGYIYKYNFGKYYLEIEEGDIVVIMEGSEIESDLIWNDHWAGKTNIEAEWSKKNKTLMIDFTFTAKESGKDLVVNFSEWFVSDESCEAVSRDLGMELEEVKKIRDRLNEKLAMVYSKVKEVVKRYCREVVLIAEEMGWRW
jgi:hypothetical protein